MSETRVIVIPRNQPIKIDATTGKQCKRKVCAYARVSTDFEDQLNSFENQKKVYEEKISSNPEWEFVKLYSDEGITGTSTKKRDGFNQMVKDAKDGKIDLILVKSISRFARNTVDCLKTKRELEAKGVEIFFEKENISSLDSSAETMLTIYASFAQEESRQISTNVTWGVRARMKSGTYRYSKKILGYINKGNNVFEIDPNNRKTIEQIFQMFINGYSFKEIVNYLIKNNMKTVKGDLNWNISSIDRILSNEKYCGDLIYQKTFCKNYLSHERVVNNGEVEQYLISNHHEPIIRKELFMFVQELRKNRRESYDSILDNSNNSALAGLFQCAECGRNLQKIHYKRGNYDKVVLTCKYTSKNKKNYQRCTVSETIDFENAKEFVIHLMKEIANSLDLNLIKESIIESQSINNYYKQTERINANIKSLEAQLIDLIKQQINTSLSESEYKRRYEHLQAEISANKEALRNINQSKFIDVKNQINIRDFNRFLKENQYLSPRLITSFIKKIFRLNDNSLMVIKTNKNLTKKEIDDIRTNLSKFANLEPLIFESKGGPILYRVIEL